MPCYIADESCSYKYYFQNIVLSAKYQDRLRVTAIDKDRLTHKNRVTSISTCYVTIPGETWGRTDSR